MQSGDIVTEKEAAYDLHAVMGDLQYGAGSAVPARPRQPTKQGDLNAHSAS